MLKKLRKRFTLATLEPTRSADVSHENNAMFHIENHPFSFNDLPDEILITVTNYLVENERKKLACVSRHFFDFIQAFYTHTTYGKLLFFLPYLDEQLKTINSAIEDYQKSQQMSFFNPRRNQYCINLRIMGFILLIYIAWQFLGFFNNARNTMNFLLPTLDRYYNLSVQAPELLAHLLPGGQAKQKDFIAFMFEIKQEYYFLLYLLVASLFFSCCEFFELRAEIHSGNTLLSHSRLDQYAIDKLYHLIEKYPFLFSQELLTPSLNGSLTFQRAHVLLHEISDDVKDTASALRLYHGSLLGKKADQIDLDPLKESQRPIIAACLDQWNEGNVTKSIAYRWS